LKNSKSVFVVCSIPQDDCKRLMKKEVSDFPTLPQILRECLLHLGLYTLVCAPTNQSSAVTASHEVQFYPMADMPKSGSQQAPKKDFQFVFNLGSSRALAEGTYQAII